MRKQVFVDRLNSRRAISYRYTSVNLAGLVNIWFHKNHFVLSWEECKDGDQWNENNCNRDEIHSFADVDAVVKFLENSGIASEFFA